MTEERQLEACICPRDAHQRVEQRKSIISGELLELYYKTHVYGLGGAREQSEHLHLQLLGTFNNILESFADPL